MFRFNCISCGKCCIKFGGKGLPLFDFEVEKARRLAGNKKLNVLPTEIFLDKKSGKKFAVLYGLFEEPCPFLEDKKCSIYKERFLICGQFPLFCSAEFKFAKIAGLPEFMECKNFDCTKNFSEFLGKETKSLKEIQDYLAEVYGSCFEGCLKSNKETDYIMNELLEMEKQGKIDLESVDYRTGGKGQKVMSLKEFLQYKQAYK